MIMKFKTLCVSTLALLPLCLSAKEVKQVDLEKLKHPVKPMLWKIEGKELKKPSYLFGTIHLSDSRLTTLHPLAQQAFEQANAVYTEIDLSPANQMKAAMFFMRQDDKTLEEVIGKETLTALDAELKLIKPGLDARPFEKMHVWAIALMLPQLKVQMQGQKALDLQLWERAQKAGKKTAALETLEDQLGKFDKFTLGDQKELLDTTLKMMKLAREKGIDPYQSMIDGYLTADQEALVKEMSKTSFMGIKIINPETQKKFLRLLLDERNKGMAKSIQKTLEDPDAGSCFFAAGTLHYLGDKSVNSLLQEVGYKVTLVTK